MMIIIQSIAIHGFVAEKNVKNYFNHNCKRFLFLLLYLLFCSIFCSLTHYCYCYYTSKILFNTFFHLKKIIIVVVVVALNKIKYILLNQCLIMPQLCYSYVPLNPKIRKMMLLFLILSAHFRKWKIYIFIFHLLEKKIKYLRFWYEILLVWKSKNKNFTNSSKPK